MKAFHEQNYPYTLNVEVTAVIFGEKETWKDAIKGLNRGHALYMATENWPNCTIKPLVGFKN